MKNSFIQNIFFISVFTLSIILINNELIEQIIWKFPKPFGDYLQQLTWLKCNHEGYDLYNNKSVGCTGHVAFNYGKIFLITPYNEKLHLFYEHALPYILIFIFIYQVMKIIKPHNKTTYFLFVLSIINPSTLLLMERGNFDIIIFITIIFIVYNRYSFINYIVLFYLSLIKFYPAILFINVFLESKLRNIKKILAIIFLIFLSFTIYLMFNLEEYSYLFNNLSQTKAGYHYLFSLNTLSKIFKYLGMNYILSILIFYSIFIFGLIKLFRKINYNYSNYDLDIYSINSRFFILGGFLSFFCFIIFSNWFYREVFLILTFPLISSMYYKYKDNFFRLLLYFIILRYVFLFIYGYFKIHDGIKHINDERILSLEFISIISIKGFIDFILMMVIGSILVLYTNTLIKDLKLKYKNFFKQI